MKEKLKRNIKISIGLAGTLIISGCVGRANDVVKSGRVEGGKLDFEHAKPMEKTINVGDINHSGALIGSKKKKEAGPKGTVGGNPGE